MSTENRCPQCGAELSANAVRGLCPACLLKKGLETQSYVSEGGNPSEAAYAPPTPTELAAYFPDLEILELIGRGGMGVVYKARQKQLGRLVALKILSPKIGQDPAFAERFAREARSLAMLNHPQIVAVYSSGQTPIPLATPGRGAGGEGHLYYFLMEYVDGVNLRRLLDAEKLAPEQALAIVPQICEALQFAHDKGVVHRDIKPENILLDKSGQVKIADFGLAKLTGRESPDIALSATNQVMGTPYYMAPEQTERPREVDHRADIYSLGVVFYQMLTGELPLGRFAPPSKKVQIDVRLDEVVLRALEKEPEHRYQQVSEMQTQIESIATSPSPASTEAGASGRLNTKSLSASILVFAAAVLIACGSFIQHGDTKLFVQVVGCLVGIIGLRGWFAVTKGRDVFSALILVFAAAVLIAGGSFIQHSDTKLFVQVVGCFIGVIGLGGWFVAFKGYDESSARAVGSASASPPLDVQYPVTTPPSTGGAGGTPPPSPVDQAAIDQALQQVQAPAIGLLILGILHLIAMGPALLIGLSYLNMSRYHLTDFPAPLLPLILFVLWLPLGIFTVIAALKMKQLRAYGLAVAASILAIISMNPIGIAIGIWALVVLNQPEVRKAFWKHKIAIVPQPVPLKAKRFGLAAFLLCLFGIPISLFAVPFAGSSAGTQLSWAGISVSFFLIQILALLCGIFGRKSGLGIAAIVVSSTLLLLSMPFAAYQDTVRIRHDFGGTPELVSVDKIAGQSTEPWMAKLPQSGITVELLGVRENKKENDGPWWRPDGSPLMDRPYEILGGQVYGGDSLAREFAVRLSNMPSESLGIQWQFEPPCGMAGGYTPSKGPEDIRAVAASFPKNKQTANIRFGIADGPWETVTEGSGGSAIGIVGDGLALSEPYEKDGTAMISVAHTLSGKEFRLVAVGKDEKEHPSDSSSTRSTGNMSQITARFRNLTLKDILVFRLQARPYKWVEFQNVSLRPTMGEKPSEPITSGKSVMEIEIETVAKPFMEALRDRDLEKMKSLSLGSVEGWIGDASSRGRAGKEGLSEASLKAMIEEIRDEVFAQSPQLLTDIQETVKLADYAAVRIPGPDAKDHLHYLRPIFKETPQGWRFLSIDDSRRPLYESLVEYIETMKTAKNTSQAAPSQQIAFGPVIERTLTETEMLDVDTETIVNSPSINSSEIESQMNAAKSGNPVPPWMRQRGIDFCAGGSQLAGADVNMIGLESEDWSKISPTALQEKIRSLNRKRPPQLSLPYIKTGVYGFQTREGGIGLMQILDSAENSPGVKIRYKLIRKPVPAEAAAFYDSIKEEVEKAVKALREAGDVENAKNLPSKFEPQYKKLEEMLKGTVAEIPYAELKEKGKVWEKELNAEKDAQKQKAKAQEMIDKAKNVESLIHGTTPPEKPVPPEKPAEPQGPKLIYEIDPKTTPGELTDAVMDNVMQVVERRLNIGVEKIAIVRKLDERRLEIALMRQNDADKKRVERLLARAGTLEFRILASERDKEIVEQARKEESKTELLDASGKRLAFWVPLQDQTKDVITKYPKNAVRTRKEGEREIAEVLVLDDSYNITGLYLTKAGVVEDNGHPCINFTFNAEGGELFGKLTGEHLPDEANNDFRYQLGIVLDGKLYSAPNIQSTITNSGQIAGNFTKEEAADLADILNAGSLPVRLRLVTTINANR